MLRNRLLKLAGALKDEVGEADTLSYLLELQQSLTEEGTLSNASSQRRDENSETNEYRHIVSVSGGKDSGTCYLYAAEYPDLSTEYVFCDTGSELPETYEYA